MSALRISDHSSGELRVQPTPAALLLNPVVQEGEQGCEQLLECTSIHHAEALLERLVRAYGFEHYLYTVRMALEGGAVFEHVSTNWDARWLQRYQEKNYTKIDPAVLHCSRHVTPLQWSEPLYATRAQQDLLQDLQAHGMRSGISIPMHGNLGETAMLSLSIDGRSTSVDHFIERIAPMAQQLASYAHEALRRCVLRDVNHSEAYLTPRENECLRWVALGKTNWEMARILVVSEHAITYHLRNVMRKLQVTSRHQAVRRAVALGLLEI